MLLKVAKIRAPHFQKVKNEKKSEIDEGFCKHLIPASKSLNMPHPLIFVLEGRGLIYQLHLCRASDGPGLVPVWALSGPGPGPVLGFKISPNGAH